MSSSVTEIVGGFEILLAAFGVVLWWRLVLKSTARVRRIPPALPRWDVRPTDFLLFILFVIGGSLVFGLAGGAIAKQLAYTRDQITIMSGAGTQLGMLAGVLYFWSRPENGRPRTPPNAPNAFLAGSVTFLMALPLVILTTHAWHFLLEQVGLPIERQDLIGIFRNIESPWQLGLLITLAIVIAPLTEELVFRGGLYRFLHTRVATWAAISFSSVLFAVVHANLASLASLVVLAMIFALAYRHTGSIGAPVVAHALFNLNTLILLFSGVGN